MIRFEFKYVLDPQKALRIRDFIEKIGLDIDPNSKKGFYTVNSIYFDTPNLDDYHDKDASLLSRRKVRARIYKPKWNSDQIKTVWLEVKKKHNMIFNKTRLPIDVGTWQQFIKKPTETLSKKLKNSEFAYLFLKHNYRPHTIIKYERLAYIDKFTNPVRITFDQNIRSCNASNPLGEEFMVDVSGNRVTMEVKFKDKLPWWFDKMMVKFNIRRTDFSKYRNATAKIRGVYRRSIYK